MRYLVMFSLGLSLLAFNNCSNVDFDKGSSSLGSTGTEGSLGAIGTDSRGNSSPLPGGTNNPNGLPTDTAGNVINQPTVPLGTGGTPVNLLPVIDYLPDICVAGGICKVDYVLDKAYPGVIEIFWHTNDEWYKEPRKSPNEYQHAQPGVHYESNSGVLRFNPGETKKTVFVKNINKNPALAVSINLRMPDCMYNSYFEDCRIIFPKLNPPQ
jgi:hypothetical protein